MRIGLCLSFDGVHWTRLEGDHHSGREREGGNGLGGGEAGGGVGESGGGGETVKGLDLGLRGWGFGLGFRSEIGVWVV
jgi:hypothetical protein